jgi:gag-polypeptide of LTR copia-type
LTSATFDPDIWITELELLIKRLKALKSNIDDEDFVMQIIHNIPIEYNPLVEVIEEDRNKKLTDQTTVKRVREKARFQRMAMRNGNRNSPISKQEVVLTVAH